MNTSLIANSQDLENIPKLSFQELDSGVFEKPTKLSDFLFLTSGKRKIIACDNANDIRFVESVVKRKGLSIKRISPLVNPSELNSIASWLQSKQDDVTVVCPSNVLIELIEKHPPAYIILYSPNPSEELIQYALKQDKVKIFTLASPAELSGFLTKCQSINQEFSQISVENSFITGSILSFIKEKLSRTKTQTPGTMSSITETILGDKDLASSIIEKLLYFFLENTAGAIGESIDEELGICKPSEEERNKQPRQSRDQSRSRSSNYKENYQDSSDDHEEDEDQENNRDSRETRNDNRNDRRDTRNDSRNNNRDNNRDSNRDAQRNNKRNDNRDNDRDDDRDNNRDNSRQSNSRDDRNDDNSPRVKKMRYRFYVGLGEEHDLGIQSMRDLLGDVIGADCRVQRVHLRSNYSFVDMESQNLEDLLKSVSHVRYQGKLVHLDLAEEMGESMPYRGNRGGGHRGNRGGYNNRGGQNRNRNNRNYSR